MSAQDAVDNTRAKQGIPNSISPNFTADQLQEIVDALDASYNRKAYIVLESTVVQVISTDQAAPTVLDNWTVLKSNGMSLQGDSIRNDTGRALEAMSGTIGMHPQVDGGGGARLVNLTSEVSPDGVAYTISNQNRPIFTNNNTESYNTKESYTIDVGIGEYIRFIVYASGSLSIAPSSTMFRNQSITGPAALWILIES